uniref:Rhodanese domain-containing protein n=1 Tax=Panagrolaimus sp. ES5 TaxID=591445 RepID=A0AC34GNW6_9BILA
MASSSSCTVVDEPTKDSFYDTQKREGYSTTTTTTSEEEEELSYDSGISCDSLSSSNSSFASSFSENLHATSTSTIGATNFGEICLTKSPELPADYFKDLDENENSAADSLDSLWDFNEAFGAESCGRKSPELDLPTSSSTQNSQSIVPPESPVSRETSRNEEKKFSRKRSLRSSLTQEMFENPTKRFRPQFHRAFSSSELQTRSYSDSSQEATTTKYSLKVVNRIRSTDIAFGRIDSKYLADLIKTMGEKFYEQYILIDCRYPFEYNGGHIKVGLNISYQFL